MPAEHPWFRIHVVVECAFELDPSNGTRLPELPVHTRKASNQARAVISRVNRTDIDLRDVARALLEAIAHLERDVERLNNRLQLGDRGINLEAQMLYMGGDGLRLDRKLPFAPGQYVLVFLDLPVSPQSQLVVASAQVIATLEGTSLHFTQLRPETRDRIIAFLFQQQAKERRRALDATAG